MGHTKSNGTLKLIGIVVGVVVTIGLAGVGVVYAYGGLNKAVVEDKKDLIEDKANLEKHCAEDAKRDEDTLKRVRATERATDRMEMAIGSIKEDMTEQKAMSKEILKEIRARH